ncbi:glycosyltransferase [Cognatiluteimonas weifangensis]|uniref:glycosyltransferase n=1 Tax=Cognatiluteimonas weifangensis TaxID=2303539 RepID=UPI001F2F4FA7|nr:glycosyltransferase [Luteimonas weifangensis]
MLVLASTYPRWRDDPEPGFVHELSRRLSAEFDVTVLCPHAAGAAPRETMDGVRVLRYRYAPAGLETLVNDGGIVTNLKRHPWKWLLVPGFVLGLLWQAWRTRRRLRPGVVHAHWLLPQGLVAALLGTPFLVTSHGADLFALQAAPLQALKRLVVRRATAVTVVSQAMRAELHRVGATDDKIRVQSMGVDLRQRFTPDPAQARSADEILFVGRLVEKKGLRHLIDALPAILAAHPQAFLSIAGFGPEERERRQQAARLGLQDRVRFLGAVPQPQLPALYRRAAVLAAPFVATGDGDREGLGLVLVEALGCGCPVVTTALPTAREIFGNAPAPDCVTPGSVAALAAGVGRILAAPEQARLRAMALRDRLLPRFDWDATAAAYARTLRAITGAHA